MGPNSLDALCKRYGIDATRRASHGALLDAELLAEVYIELIGGRQAATDAGEREEGRHDASWAGCVPIQPATLAAAPTDIEIAAHGGLVATLGQGASGCVLPVA